MTARPTPVPLRVMKRQRLLHAIRFRSAKPISPGDFLKRRVFTFMCALSSQAAPKGNIHAVTAAHH